MDEEMELLEEALLPVVKVVNELRATSGSNDKIKKLKMSANVPHLQEIFQWTYDPFLKYGVSKTMIEKLASKKTAPSAFKSYFDLVDLMSRLAKLNINDDLRTEIAYALHATDNPDIIDLLKCILTKDLKIGMAAANINKAIPELIPVFDVMRGQKYADHKHKLIGKDIIITEKIDGVRTVAIIDELGSVKFYSRQGKEITGLVDIEKDIKKMNLKNIVLDGETTIFNKDNMDSKDVFKATMEIMGAKMDEKLGLLYNVFDCMPLSAFKGGICRASALNRKKYFEEKWFTADSCPNHVKPLPVLYGGKYDENKVKEIHSKILANGGEGIMINVASAPYECKRTANLLKVKEMDTCDLKIIGFEEGIVGSKFDGTLGALVVDYKGYQVKVGSGFTEENRDFFWNNKETLLGRVVEVQYFEETQDADGNLSLRFPVFVQLREIGKEVSYD